MSTDSIAVIEDVILYGRIVCVFSVGLFLESIWTKVLPAIGFGLALMAMGTLCFVSVPTQMLRIFTADEQVIAIGRIGFRFVGVSFLPMVTSLIFPVFFQAVGASLKSSSLTVIRTMVLFVSLGFLFSRWGLNWFWMTFPVTEVITSLVGVIYYRHFLKTNAVKNSN